MKHYKFKDNLTAIILCGGKGTRLYPLTKNTPKPLIKIKNKEILKYILDHLFKARINNIILATGYKHKSFKNFYLKLIPNLKSKIKDKDKNDFDDYEEVQETNNEIHNKTYLLKIEL